MKNIDSIINQIRQGIKQQEDLISKTDPITEEGQRTIEYYRYKIAELEYRIRELEEHKISSILVPEYGDGKHASDRYKEALDILRVCYYNYFHQDPSFSPVPKWNVMFYDSTLFLPVKTYLVKGNIPFQIMFTGNYPDHESDPSKSISIHLPFEVLSEEDNEEYLRCMLELIKIYSGDRANLVFGDGTSTRGTLSYIADKDFPGYSLRGKEYYEFFKLLCDNNIRNILYIGASIKEGVTPEEIEKTDNDIITIHKKLTAGNQITDEDLERSNEKIKKRILSIMSN